MPSLVLFRNVQTQEKRVMSKVKGKPYSCTQARMISYQFQEFLLSYNIQGPQHVNGGEKVKEALCIGPYGVCSKCQESGKYDRDYCERTCLTFLKDQEEPGKTRPGSSSLVTEYVYAEPCFRFCDTC